MRLSIITLFTAGLALVSALAIPPLEVPANDTLAISEQEGVIPIAFIKCTDYRLDPRNINEARRKLANWGLRHKVPGKSVKKERSGDMAWYVCNCKWLHKDGLAMTELMEAERAIFKECGLWKSGWLYSHKWEKLYQIQSMDWISKLPETWNWCPHYCVFFEVGKGKLAIDDATLNSTDSEESYS
ncbi:uncharacterized protein GGS22DRAFT_183518 [Annulohypoxylon maeteangense]|uniref:uncharacterized protein n=1 Tax=Annulohypoxylon maeteangense TaxID=1927788 RepID=UPI0020077A5D|nr:uncharacterized protein GGS22DRAFT_183518 [Annulohypoxylon maeteangense]KAI0890171.1 hypothetical protein GGS22DRAFT_183518 [Annulohypoxylon maeteangense]